MKSLDHDHITTEIGSSEYHVLDLDSLFSPTYLLKMNQDMKHVDKLEGGAIIVWGILLCHLRIFESEIKIKQVEHNKMELYLQGVDRVLQH